MRARPFVLFTILTAAITGPAPSMDLRETTLESWQQYVHDATLRMETRLNTDGQFLWIDEAADRKLRVHRGEIIVAPAVEHGARSVPNGLIHDWIGGVFIPGATITALLDVLRDYDRYKEIYQPVVTNSEALVCCDSDQEFAMTWQRHVLGVSAAMRARYRAHEVMIDPQTGYSLVESTRVQQIKDFGRTSECLLKPDQGSGFIWRVYSISRYKARDDGVYLEIEAMVLSRDIPPSFHWLVSPVVNRLSTKSLVTTLRQTREAVTGKSRSVAQGHITNYEGQKWSPGDKEN